MDCGVVCRSSARPVRGVRRPRAGMRPLPQAVLLRQGPPARRLASPQEGGLRPPHPVAVCGSAGKEMTPHYPHRLAEPPDLLAREPQANSHLHSLTRPSRRFSFFPLPFSVTCSSMTQLFSEKKLLPFELGAIKLKQEKTRKDYLFSELFIKRAMKVV